MKGPVHSQEPATTNTYNQNFRNRFCACEEWYDPAQQKGTMFQCIGLVTEENGGCGEDWWHPECLIGLPRDWHTKPEAQAFIKKVEPTAPQTNADDSSAPQDTNEPETEQPEHPVPPGFPDEESFDQVVCYKCVEKVPWLKPYVHAAGFIGLPKKGLETKDAVIHGSLETTMRPKEFQHVPTISETTEPESVSRKRRRDEADGDDESGSAAKKAKVETPTDESERQAQSETQLDPAGTGCKIGHLPEPPEGLITILAPEEFRDKFCRCKQHYLQLREYPMLLEDEETYEPPLSEDGDAPNGAGSVGTGSLLDRGEAALSNVDRVRAIEGVMVYNHLKSKVKDFLKPFAENGQMVSAEDIKAYFEKLRGDAEAIRDAKTAAAEDADGDGDHRHEQSGY